MELLYDESPASLAAALVARYASLPSSSFFSYLDEVSTDSSSSSFSRPHKQLTVSFIGPLAKQFLSQSLQALPLLLMDEGKTVLQEPAAILRCCATAAAAAVGCKRFQQCGVVRTQAHSSNDSSKSTTTATPTRKEAAAVPVAGTQANNSISSGGGSSSSGTAAAATNHNLHLLLGGPSSVAQAQVMQWLAFCCDQQFVIQSVSSRQQLQQHLSMNTFLVGTHVTLADLAVYAACYSWMATASEKERLSHCNVTRWFDHVQHLPGVAGSVEQLEIVNVIPPSLSSLPQLPRPVTSTLKKDDSSSSSRTRVGKMMLPNGVGGELTAKEEEEAKQKKKKNTQQQQKQEQQQQQKQRHGEGEVVMNGGVPSPPPQGGGGGGANKTNIKKDSSSSSSSSFSSNQKEQRKKADSARGLNSGGGGKNTADTRPVDDITRLRVVVGHVRKVWRHPDADQLFCEEVDIGEEQGPRLIASGLVRYTTAEQLQGQHVLVLANMKPKPLRGFTSQGMLLCASSPDHSQCEILRPPEDVPVGETITWEGIDIRGAPDAPHMNTKEGKYPFAAVQPNNVDLDMPSCWQILILRKKKVVAIHTTDERR